MNPQLNGPRFIRNLAIGGGIALAADVLIPGARSDELIFQAWLVLLCGLSGLFRRGGGGGDSG